MQYRGKNDKQNKKGYSLIINDGRELSCKYLVAAPGRSGAEWFSTQCRNLGLSLINNQVDIGVRVELPAIVFKHITDAVYESKFLYRTKQYGDIVRTFCMNPYGYVVSENVDGIITVNGHSYTDIKLRRKYELCTVGQQSLYRTIQRTISIRKKYCIAFEYAWRRGYCAAVR